MAQDHPPKGYLYNVTVKVTLAASEDWLQWMLEEHMPAIIATGFFQRYRLVRLLDLDDEAEGPTFAAQYFCETIGQYQQYIAEKADEMRAAGHEKFGNAYSAFRTVMEIVAEG